MDILYTEKVDGFCIASGDSDFTRLATGLREAGMLVIGSGEKKTPKPFIAACDKFIYLEILKNSCKDPQLPETAKQNEEALGLLDKEIVRLVMASSNDLTDEEGYASLASPGCLLIKKKPDFDPRNYGFSKLLLFITAVGKFEIDDRETGIENVRHIYIKPVN